MCTMKIRSEQPSLVSDGFVQKVDQIVRENRRRTLNEIHKKCAEGSQLFLTM